MSNLKNLPDLREGFFLPFNVENRIARVTMKKQSYMVNFIQGIVRLPLVGAVLPVLVLIIIVIIIVIPPNG